jgi:hypothetical protein
MKRTLNKELFLLINGLIGISLMIALSVFFKSTDKSGNPELFIAAENMERSLKIIQDYCIQNHINTGNPEDPQHTGLIGPEWSGITTTIGDPEAKRTTINPNFAALIAHFLQQAGVKRAIRSPSEIQPPSQPFWSHRWQQQRPWSFIHWSSSPLDLPHLVHRIRNLTSGISINFCLNIRSLKPDRLPHPSEGKMTPVRNSKKQLPTASGSACRSQASR